MDSIRLTHLPISQFNLHCDLRCCRHFACWGHGGAQLFTSRQVHCYRYECRSVVLDTIFSILISIFEPALAYVPVMSDWSLVRNIFPALVTWAKLLCPFHDLNRPTHPNEEFDHGWLHDAPAATPWCSSCDSMMLQLRLHCSFPCSITRTGIRFSSMCLDSIEWELIATNCKCGSVLARVETRLSLVRWNVGTSASVGPPLTVALLAERDSDFVCCRE